MNADRHAYRPLVELARDVPRRSDRGPVDVSTLVRWALKGVGGVRLDVIRIGGTLCSTPAALKAFLREIKKV